MKVSRSTWLATATMLTLVSSSAVASAAVPEGQPESLIFPQNRSYLYGTDSLPYRQSYHPEGWLFSTDDYYLYEPVDGAWAITSAPVVVFFPGYVVDGPEQVDRLIRHLTRSGMTVIFPTYLNVWGNSLSFADWVDRSTASIERALAELEKSDHVPVETDLWGRKKIAFVSHSIGSYVATFVAERAAQQHVIPEPRVLAFMDPAGFDYKWFIGIDMTRLDHIDATTDVIMLSAEDSLLDQGGKVATNTQLAVLDFVDYLPVRCDHLSAWVVPSDSEGETHLESDHYHGPQTHQVFDAVDWWGYWPQISAHLRYAFWGTYGAFTHAGGLYGGTWRDSDGGYRRDIARKRPHPLYPLGYACPW